MHRGMSLLLIGAIIMALAIIYAIVFGNFAVEARTLFPLPWFQLSLIDLYVGFFLFAGWIFYRESSRSMAIGWLILLCLLGNLAACIYAIRALMLARGDWGRFWMGHHATSG